MKTTDKDKRLHHWCGPSSWWRVANCPGSHQLIDSLGLVEHETDWQAQGTRRHEAIAARLGGPEIKHELDDEDEEIVARAVEYDRMLQEQYHPYASDTEALVWLRGNHGLTLAFGWADRRHFVENGAAIVDWKAGEQEPELDQVDYQMRLQAAAAHQTARMAGVPLSFVNVYVYSPKFDRDWTAGYGSDVLPAVVKELEYDQERAMAKNAEFQVGPWCRYCKALAHCHKARDEAMELVRASPNPPVDERALGIHFAKLKIAEKWVEEEIKRVKAVSRSGGPNPMGYGWTTRKGNLEVPDTRVAFERLAGYLTPAEFVDSCCRATMTRIKETMLPRLRQELGLSEAAATKKLEEILGDAVKRRPDIDVFRQVKEKP